MARFNVTEIKVYNDSSYSQVNNNMTGQTGIYESYSTIIIQPVAGKTIPSGTYYAKITYRVEGETSDCPNPIKQPFTVQGGGGGCNCTNVSYSTTSLSWPNGETTPQSVTITPPNGCTISELGADFSGRGDEYFTTAKTTNQITVTPRNGITSSLVTDTLTISFKLTGNAQSCTKPISVSWKKATPVTCDCSSAPTLTYNGQTLQEPLTWDNDDTNTRQVNLSLGNCAINNIQARIKEERLREYFGITGSPLGAESSIVLGPNGTHTPSEDINATVEYKYKVDNTIDCTDWREFAIKWKAAQTPPTGCLGETPALEPVSLHWSAAEGGEKACTLSVGEGCSVTVTGATTDVEVEIGTVEAYPASIWPNQVIVQSNTINEFNGYAIISYEIKNETTQETSTGTINLPISKDAPEPIESCSNLVLDHNSLSWNVNEYTSPNVKDHPSYGTGGKRDLYVYDENHCAHFTLIGAGEAQIMTYRYGVRRDDEYEVYDLGYDESTKKHHLEIRRLSPESDWADAQIWYYNINDDTGYGRYGFFHVDLKLKVNGYIESNPCTTDNSFNPDIMVCTTFPCTKSGLVKMEPQDQLVWQQGETGQGYQKVLYLDMYNCSKIYYELQGKHDNSFCCDGLKIDGSSYSRIGFNCKQTSEYCPNQPAPDPNPEGYASYIYLDVRAIDIGVGSPGEGSDEKHLISKGYYCTKGEPGAFVGTYTECNVPIDLLQIYVGHDWGDGKDHGPVYRYIFNDDKDIAGNEENTKQYVSSSECYFTVYYYDGDRSQPFVKSNFKKVADTGDTYYKSNRVLVDAEGLKYPKQKCGECTSLADYTKIYYTLVFDNDPSRTKYHADGTNIFVLGPNHEYRVSQNVKRFDSRDKDIYRQIFIQRNNDSATSAMLKVEIPTNGEPIIRNLHLCVGECPTPPTPTDTLTGFYTVGESGTLKVCDTVTGVHGIKIDGQEMTPVSTTYSDLETGEYAVSIALDDGTTIPAGMFKDCTGLKSISLKDTVTTIEGNAFSGCTELVSITVPSSVTSFKTGAFTNCSSLTGVYIEDLTAWCNIDFEKNLYSNPLELGHHLYNSVSNTEITALTIPNSVTSIKNKAFNGASAITSVSIRDKVTFIGDEAFEDCKSVTSITIPSSVVTIGSYAFANCENLKSIVIPAGVTVINDSTFNGCKALTSVTFTQGNQLTKIGDSAFRDCSFESFTIPNTVTEIGSNAFTYCTKLTGITIPNNVTSIGNSTFYWCIGLTSIGIPDSVTDIGPSAFVMCSGLTSIDIPDNVTSIGSGAFTYCTGLTSIVIPSRVTSIGDGAFTDCSGLISCTIGNSVTTIGNAAFTYCTKLTGITIPNNVTSIGDSAFRHCSGLTNCTFAEGSNLTSIGNDAFQNCKGLTSINIPNSVTSIGDEVFRDCTGLTSVTIGSSVASIGKWAFGDCRNLNEIKSYPATAPKYNGGLIEYHTFCRVNEEGTLRVLPNSTGYDDWMGTGNYYLGKYHWNIDKTLQNA
jgi:hypothetical protein